MAHAVTSTQPEFLGGGHNVCVRNTFLDLADAEPAASAMLLRRSVTLPVGRVWATSWQCSIQDDCQDMLDSAEKEEAAEADDEDEKVEEEHDFEYNSEVEEGEDEDEEEGFIGSRWQGGAKACTFKRSVLTLSMLDTADALSHVSTQDSERSPSSGSGTLGYRYDDPDFVPSTPEPQARLHRCFARDSFGSEGCDEWTPQEGLSSCPVSEAGYGAESWGYASTQTSPPSEIIVAGEGELDYPFLDEGEETDFHCAPALEEDQEEEGLEEREPLCRCATEDGFECEEDYRSSWTPVEWQPPAAQPHLDVPAQQGSNCASLMQQPMPALVLPMMMVPMDLGQQQQCQQQPQLPSPQTTFDMDLAWREQQQFAVPSTLPQTDAAWKRLMGNDNRSGQV